MDLRNQHKVNFLITIGRYSNQKEVSNALHTLCTWQNHLKTVLQLCSVCEEPASGILIKNLG